MISLTRRLTRGCWPSYLGTLHRSLRLIGNPRLGPGATKEGSSSRNALARSGERGCARAYPASVDLLMWTKRR